MIRFYSKYKKYLWSMILFGLSFDIGLLASYSSHQNKIHSIQEKPENDQVLMVKLADEVLKMIDNGFFCHLGGVNSENMKSEFCVQYQSNKQKSAIYSLKLLQQLIDKKCQSHGLYVGISNFSDVLDIVSRNEDDQVFHFTNTNLRNAFIEQSKIFKEINIKQVCNWN